MSPLSASRAINRTGARYGKERTFAEAAARYLMENEHNRAIRREADALALVIPYIGDLPLSQVHMGTLEPFIRDRL